MIYVEKYGIIKSGGTLTLLDYGDQEGGGFVAYDDKGKLAVSLAAQDVKFNMELRIKSDFETKVKKLLS